jgi:transcriptional regulator with XRE-family HTH domain
MGRPEKPMLVGTTCVPTVGELLRRFRKEGNLSLIDMAELTHFSKGHLSNVEVGRTKISKEILMAYEEQLGFKPHEIGAFFLLIHTEVIPIDSLFTDVSQVDLNNAVEIARALDCFPLLLEPVAVFIKKTGCGLSGYLESYQSQVADELRRHNRPSLVEFRLRALLKNQSERSS